MGFVGWPGVATAIGLFAILWFTMFVRTKGTAFTFDPGGNEGEFGRSLLPMYIDITKFVAGLAAGSIVFCLFGSSSFSQAGPRSLKAFASPLFMVAMSIIFGVLFIVFLVLNYENHRNKPEDGSYTRFKYTRNQAFGFSSLACFCVGYVWLIAAATR